MKSEEKINGAEPVRKKNIRLGALSLDLIVSTLASFLAILYVRWMTAPVFEFGHYVHMWVLLGFVVSLVAILLIGTHKIVIKHTTLASLGKLVEASLVKDILLSALIFTGLFRLDGIAPSIVMLVTADWLITVVMLVVVRVIVISIYNDLKSSVEKDVDRIPLMVFGTSEKAVAMVLRLKDSVHYNVLGYLTRDRAKDGLIAQDCKAYYFENENDVERLKIGLGFQSVIFVREEDLEVESKPDGLAQICFRKGVQCLTAPKIDYVDLGGIAASAAKSVVNSSVDYIPDGMSAFERNVKRFIDFLLASLLLIVFSPLFLICYIAIKAGDGGPAIYKQERIGRFGRPFSIYKFRSMRVDAESAGPALFSGDEDPRLTRVGKFLRMHHLDELPQLFNVWRGDMAFVGPRPERKFYIDQIMERDPRYYFLYQIRPGVTSYATLKNGYTDTIEKMLRRMEFDLYYLRHRSWWFDVRILWQTFTNIVFGKIF